MKQGGLIYVRIAQVILTETGNIYSRTVTVNENDVRYPDPGLNNTWQRIDNYGTSSLSDLAAALGGFKKYSNNTTWQSCADAGVPVSTEIWNGTMIGWPKSYGVGIVFPSAGQYGNLSLFVGADSDYDNVHFLIKFSDKWIEVGSYPRT